MTVCFYIPVGLLVITTLMYYRFLCIAVVQSTPDNLVSYTHLTLPTNREV